MIYHIEQSSLKNINFINQLNMNMVCLFRILMMVANCFRSQICLNLLNYSMVAFTMIDGALQQTFGIIMINSEELGIHDWCGVLTGLTKNFFVS